MTPQHPTSQEIEAEARDWLVLLESGRANAADLARLREWRATSAAHESIFARERDFLRGVSELTRQSHPGPVPADPGRRRLLRGSLGLGAMAAAGAGAAVFGPGMLLDMQADSRTPIGEQASVTLPDGSRALLNTDTALGYGFDHVARGVTLMRGEVLITAPAGTTPFTLTRAGLTARSDGGRLMGRLDGARITLAALDAPLAIATESGTAQILPGEMLRWSPGAPPGPPQPQPEGLLDWAEGRIRFNASPFATALAELGRYIPERVVLWAEGSAGAAVSGDFRTADARLALSALAATQRLSVRRIPGVALIVS